MRRSPGAHNHITTPVAWLSEIGRVARCGPGSTPVQRSMHRGLRARCRAAAVQRPAALLRVAFAALSTTARFGADASRLADFTGRAFATVLPAACFGERRAAFFAAFLAAFFAAFFGI